MCSIRPNKSEIYRTRLTAGGDRLEYPGITSTDTVSLCTAKIHINSVISAPNGKYLVADIKDFYYGTPLTRYEYLRMHIKLVPEEIIRQYNLLKIVHNDYVYLEVRKGMPGLKQAGKVANDRLKQHLEKFGYYPAPRTPALWLHKTRKMSFTLCVDDFGIKYIDRADANHLLNCLRQIYAISVGWSGKNYIGLTLNWDYKKRKVTISMPKYIDNVLLRFQHKKPTRKQNSPHEWTPPMYGKQINPVHDKISTELPANKKLLIQQIVGSFFNTHWQLTVRY